MPLGADSVVEAIVISVSAATVTDRLASAEVMPPADAVTVVAPTRTPVAAPVELLIVAILLSPVAQFTWLVISATLPSV